MSSVQLYQMADVIVPLLILFVLIFFGIGFVLARLYRRATKDRSYVRTGLGGQHVVLDGGSLVLPVFHAVAWVNLQTLRLDVRREGHDAMITSDRMRVDIGVEFYVRVKPDAPSIALAAQTLGDRTNDAQALRELVEAKFVDALRSVAATMKLAELQEQRAAFVQAVQTAVARDLELNGLELESASLTKLDQTDTKHFNPNNAFDAEGLATLTRITEQKRQERNRVVRETEVIIAQQDLEARTKTLEIERQKQEAELSQRRDIVNKTAETRAASAEREASAQLVEQEAQIASAQAIAERRAAAKKVEEMAQIDAELAIKQRQIDSDRQAATADIEKQRDVQLADQMRAIAIADKSRAESEARAAAERARAEAVAASESVLTAQQVAIAERERQTAVITARQEAEQDATKLVVAADGEKRAALDRAEAVRTEAQAAAEALRIKAEAEAEAAKLRADAAAKTYEVDAAGQRQLNEARNLMSPAIIELEVMRERLRILPVALAESVRPLEKIGDVRIFDTGSGMPSGARAGDAPTDNLLTTLLAYRANAPVIDKLLAEAGFGTAGNQVERLLDGLQPKAPPPPES
jgi:flotillin